MTTDELAAAAAKAASAATYGGSGAAIVSGLSAEWVGVIAGVAIAILGYVTSLYFQRKKDQREQVEHEMRLRHARALMHTQHVVRHKEGIT